MTGICCTVGSCPEPDCLQLTDRELRVCETVCSSPLPLGFGSVRRAVGFHQEIVSRILRRLVNYGALEKVEGKYSPRRRSITRPDAEDVTR